MKIKIGDKIFDPNDEPIAILFDDDTDKRNVIKHLIDIPEKEGIRKYVQFPKGLSIEQIKEFLIIK